MFFILSKTVGRLVDPIILGLTLLLMAAVLRLFRRLPRLRKGLVYLAILEMFVFSIGAVSSLLLRPLEFQYSRPSVLQYEPEAIVVLSGVLEDPPNVPTFYEFNDAADRFIEALRLANRYPKARLVLSGGSPSVLGTEASKEDEADILSRIAKDLGIASSRLRIDPHSRNTRENAVESKRLLQDIKGPVVLITSASHMPRAVGCFRKVGQPVIPWPVDYQKSSLRPHNWVPRAWAVERSRRALHEYLGQLVYRLAGYL
jgi:uncharacterized SAM-binding protein YcdF (DUF218 family)